MHAQALKVGGSRHGNDDLKVPKGGREGGGALDAAAAV